MSETSSLEISNVATNPDTGAKANTEEEETVNRTLRVAGVWEEQRAQSSGVNWGPSDSHLKPFSFG